jgi:hypothetical protein
LTRRISGLSRRLDNLWSTQYFSFGKGRPARLLTSK